MSRARSYPRTMARSLCTQFHQPVLKHDPYVLARLSRNSRAARGHGHRTRIGIWIAAQAPPNSRRADSGRAGGASQVERPRRQRLGARCSPQSIPGYRPAARRCPGFERRRPCRVRCRGTSYGGRRRHSCGGDGRARHAHQPFARANLLYRSRARNHGHLGAAGATCSTPGYADRSGRGGKDEVGRPSGRRDTPRRRTRRRTPVGSSSCRSRRSPIQAWSRPR